ncbi:MAG TPA: hypothetical protein VGG75_38910 [Trebonia sp.]
MGGDDRRGLRRAGQWLAAGRGPDVPPGEPLPVVAGQPSSTGTGNPADGGYIVTGRWGFSSGITHVRGPQEAGGGHRPLARRRALDLQVRITSDLPGSVPVAFDWILIRSGNYLLDVNEQGNPVRWNKYLTESAQALWAKFHKDG